MLGARPENPLHRSRPDPMTRCSGTRMPPSSTMYSRPLKLTCGPRMR